MISLYLSPYSFSTDYHPLLCIGQHSVTSFSSFHAEDDTIRIAWQTSPLNPDVLILPSWGLACPHNSVGFVAQTRWAIMVTRMLFLLVYFTFCILHVTFCVLYITFWNCICYILCFAFSLVFCPLFPYMTNILMIHFIASPGRIVS